MSAVFQNGVGRGGLGGGCVCAVVVPFATEH
jgi:hypothetical protein